MHRSQLAMAKRAERLEDGAVEDVRADRDLGLNPNRNTSIGVISDPPPIPVMPTSRPMSRPASESFQSTGLDVQQLH
jgi:hypothetical protein